MRIIKIGKIPPPKEKRKICFNCDTEIAYTEDDIRFDMIYDKYIPCPLCNQMLSISIFDRKVKSNEKSR